MPFKTVDRLAMESFQGWTEKFAALAQTDTGNTFLQPDEASTVVAVIVGLVAVIVEGRIAPKVVQCVAKTIEPFRSRSIEGAADAQYGELYYDRTNLTGEEKEKRNYIQHQLAHYKLYLFPVEWAVAHVETLPSEQQTIENLRAAFLRSVDQFNIVTPGAESLDLAIDLGLN